MGDIVYIDLISYFFVRGTITCTHVCYLQVRFRVTCIEEILRKLSKRILETLNGTFLIPQRVFLCINVDLDVPNRV